MSRIYLAKYLSPLGPITLAVEDGFLQGLWFDGQKYDQAGLSENIIYWERTDVHEAACSWLDQFFTGKNPVISLPLRFTGSPFRQMVLQILYSVPYGCLTTYGRVASEAARRTGISQLSAQAVGNAISHNPISIIVPCHRVVGANGSLVGYAAGIERKKALLQLENIDTTSLSDPGLYHIF